ncbi:hypothetical protein D8Y20_09260 [Mariprofundus sp. EBB-1]|uniref:hypothetical protein n=1 Tax=Mariprofundus sp. EBB-1 TaxID=2650971 RepID=UPI000EF1D3CF|nr:hypothetical protein [Mariprofundus sp. EBB-1]RLL51352.1 hypothetical protein D8Y20_09260 [Mariprofundus sp. EBB-1]
MNDQKDFSHYKNVAEAFENNNETDDPLLYASRDKDIDHMGMAHLDPEAHKAIPEAEGCLSHLEADGAIEGEMAAEIDQLADMTPFNIEDDMSDYKPSRSHGMEEPESYEDTFDEQHVVAEEEGGFGKIIIASVLAIAAVIWFVWPSSEEAVLENSGQTVIEGQQNNPAPDSVLPPGQ